MNFIHKNFTYQTTSFGDFMTRCSSGSEAEYLYLRSIGTDNRGREIADIFKHFPTISQDISLPSFLPVSQESLFSSVFRISSPSLVLWNHFDILDNILVQV